MRRYDQAPIHVLDQPKKMAQRGPTWSYTVTPQGGEGSMKTPQSYISLMMWPAGWTQPWGAPHELEYHTLHEEIFFLTGTMDFGGYYSIKALGYLNHPPFWNHATNFFATKDNGMVTMLYRGGNQPIVQFEPIPENWDGRPGFAPPTRSIGTRNLQVDDVPWFNLMTKAGADTGLKAKRIAEDRDDGWTTWVMQAPKGWKAKGPPVAAKGGDEIYVIEGDLAWGGANVGLLRASGYVCDSTTIKDGAGALSSKDGALFVRWTRGAEALWQVAPQV